MYHDVTTAIVLRRYKPRTQLICFIPVSSCAYASSHHDVYQKVRKNKHSEIKVCGMGIIQAKCNEISGVTELTTELDRLSLQNQSLQKQVNSLQSSMERSKLTWYKDRSAMLSKVNAMLQSEVFLSNTLDRVNHPMLSDHEEKKYLKKVLEYIHNEMTCALQGPDDTTIHVK